jgi:hypothetical protein
MFSRRIFEHQSISKSEAKQKKQRGDAAPPAVLFSAKKRNTRAREPSKQSQKQRLFKCLKQLSSNN